MRSHTSECLTRPRRPDQIGGVSTSDDKPTGAGRGLLFISFAKLWFMVAGYAIQFGLPRTLGSAAKFGVWTLVLSMISPLNNVLVTANIQSVSKFTAAHAGEGAGDHAAAVRAGLRLQSYVASITWLLFVAVVAPLAAWFEHDMSLLPTLWLASGVVLCYSFYAVFVGAANGSRQFLKQASLDVTFSSLRAGFVLGGGYLVGTATGSVAGFVLAAALILILSVRVVGLGPKPATKLELRPMARFFGEVAIYLLVLNLVMFVDSFLLKRLATEAAVAAGLANPSIEGDTQVGLYGAVQAIARLPFQLILAVTFVIFPLMSKATFDDDRARASRYVETTLRYSLLVCVVMAVVLGARPAGTLALLYKPEYGVGAPAVPWLIFGYVAYALITIGGTLLNSAGHTRATLKLALGSLIVAVAANYAAQSWAFGAHHDPLLAGARATAAAMAAGFGWTLWELRAKFSAKLRLLSVVRTGAIAASGFGLAAVWPTTGFLAGKVGSLVFFAVAGLGCLVLAVISKELDVREILAARRAKN